VFHSQKCIRLSGLPSLSGERRMSVKVVKGTMNGKDHVVKSVIR
jgi:hypothetical protein